MSRNSFDTQIILLEEHMPPFQKIDMLHLQKTGVVNKDIAVSTESPLTICINNDLFDQIMRTPGDEKALVTGLLFSNKLLFFFKELTHFTLTTTQHGDTVHIQIQQKRDNTSFENACIHSNQLHPQKITLTDIQSCIDALSDYQPIRTITRSTHAAILFDSDLKPIAAKEDVGRHNALDKVIGQALIDNMLDRAYILVLSSRVSHELMAKVINTPVKCIFSVSRPTSLAIDIARKYNISLVCLSKGDGVFIFSCKGRFDV